MGSPGYDEWPKKVVDSLRVPELLYFPVSTVQISKVCRREDLN